MNYKHSLFIYGHVVTPQNRYINFREFDSDEILTAKLTLGAYALTDFLTEVARAMTEVGTRRYQVTVDRQTRLVSITNEESFGFVLLFMSGVNSAASARTLLGFAYNDFVGTGFEGTLPTGKAYRPQCPLNEYVPFLHWRGANDASVNTNSTGISVIIGYGDVQRMRCNIRAITDKEMSPGSIIENNQNAVSEALEFLNYITQKNPIEFCFDREDPETFDKCVLESTRDSKSGTSFELYEGLGKGLRDIYETQTLVFRRIE